MDASVSDRLKALLGGEPDIDAAWLVGSHARGQARPDSDVDVAVLFSSAAGANEMAVTLRRGRLMDDLGGALQTHVDVLDVERVAPITFALVMKHARLLIDRNRTRRIDVMARQYALWHDMQPHYDLQRRATRDYFARRGG